MFLRFSSLDDPGLVHAVTTRHGGVSAAPHASLNMSFSRPDEPDAVRANRRRVFAALEIEPARVVQAGQVHGAEVLVVEEQHAGRGSLDRSLLPPHDALVTRVPDLYLMACFADCTPLLFFDPVQRAVGVAHAGWQGTAKHIAASTVQTMQRAFGTHPRDLRVVVGPSAGPCCYNVWPQIAEQIQSAFPDAPHVLQPRNGETYFDLWAANLATLEGAGVGREHIETSAICTIEHAECFFSHRAAQGQTGRFAAIIGVRE